MNNTLFDTFPFPIPKGFKAGMTMSCIFVHPIIYNEDEITPGTEHYKPDTKPKYCIVTAVPVEDRKLKVRSVAHIRFSCSESEYNFFLSCVSDLRGQAIYLGVDVNSWANSSERHGVWYRYVSDSMTRFDGKPLSSAMKNLENK